MLGVATPVLGQTVAPKTIYIQPIGTSTSSADREAVRSTLTALYGLPVVVLAPISMPACAYVAANRRYRADIALEYLRSRLPADGFRILGLTADDVSTTMMDHPDWGVIGLASYEGRACIVSTFRCGGAHTTVKQRRDRLTKVAIHEVGHTLGLPHCSNPGCLMADARGSVRTVDGEFDLCAACRDLSDQAGCTLLAGVQLPWMPPPTSQLAFAPGNSTPVPLTPVALTPPPVTPVAITPVAVESPPAPAPGH